MSLIFWYAQLVMEGLRRAQQEEMGNGTDRGLRSTADSTGLLYVVQHRLGPQMCTAPLALPGGRFENLSMCSLSRASPVSVIGYIQLPAFLS